MNKFLLSIFIIVLSFGAGFFFNEIREFALIELKELKKNQEITLIPEKPINRLEIINKEKDKPEHLDFSTFWNVWYKLEKKHIDLNEDIRKKMFEGAIKGIIRAVGDEHTEFLNPENAKEFIKRLEEEKFEGVGMHITIELEQLRVVAPLKGTPAYKAGIQAGDKIIKIDGELTEGITLIQAVSLIRGPIGTDVNLTILRDKKEIEKSIIRGIIVIPASKLTFLDDGKIAHIKIFNFKKGTFGQVKDIAKEINNSDATKIILDLRNNPGGLLTSAIDVTGLFLERNSIVVIQQKRGKKVISRTRRDPLLKNIEIVILVNKGSASASEIFAGALRDNRGIQLIGEVTFGKGSVQELKNLPDGSILKITTAYWLTPSRYKIEDKGLIPDIEVKNTIEKLMLGVDSQLQRAIDELKN